MEKDKKRSSTILIIFLIGTIILIAKALQLQVIDEGFRNRASSMVVERYTQYPSRGLIYDRNRKLLVYNNPMYDLLATVKRINPAMDTNRFCSLLNISKETFIKNLDKDWKMRSEEGPCTLSHISQNSKHVLFHSIVFESYQCIQALEKI